MKYTRKIRLVLLFLTIAFATFGAVTANAAPNFNSSNTVSLKKNKKKSAKLKGLSKSQKKKKWTFKSSDTSIVKVKRSGKYGYKLTANKKKDGYAVIRATQSKTAIYLLVKVGKGSTSINGTTKAWATYGRSHYKQGTSAYNTWNKVVNPNSGGNGGNPPKPTPTPTPTPTDPYKGMTAVPASYGADGNHIYPITTGTGADGKDKNGFYYMLVYDEAIIGYDKKGKAIKAQIAPITFTIETVPWFDQYLRSFDNGYYAGNGGPNYVGKNTIFTTCNHSTETMGIVKITTSAPIDDANARALHGVTITKKFINGSWSGQSCGSVPRYTDWSFALGGTPTTVANALTPRKMNGVYYDLVSSQNAYGTYRYSVTIDGVTKYVDFNIVDQVTEFKNWYIHKYDTLPQAEVNASITETNNLGLGWPASVVEAYSRIYLIHGLINNHKMNAYVFKTDSDLRRGIPSFIATSVFSASNLKTPGCSLAQAYSNYAADAIQAHHPEITQGGGYWNTTVVQGSGHTFGYNAIWYNGESICYPYFYG